MTTLTFTQTDGLSAAAWDQAAGHVAQNAPEAHRLPALEEVMDADLHGVWLDKQTATVWHAWADTDTHGHLPGAWLLESEPAATALAWMEEQACHVLDALAEPESHYDTGHRTPGEDLEVLDELHAVRLAAMRDSAQRKISAADGEVTVTQVVEAEILRAIQRARREVGLLADLRAHHLRDASGDQWGGLARLAREIGMGENAARKALATADARRERIIAAAQEARTVN